MSYITGDTDIAKSLKARFTSEKDVTVEYVVNEATEIFKKIKNVPNTDKDNDEFLSKMRTEHPQFSTSYPVVLRHICQVRAYSPKIFKLWLDKIKHNPWKSEDEYLEAQVDYTHMLYRHKNPRADMRDLRNHKDGVRKMLFDEHKKFKKYAEDFTAKVTAEEEEAQKRNLAELLEYCTKSTHELPLAGTVRVETDDITDVERPNVKELDLVTFDISADLLLD